MTEFNTSEFWGSEPAFKIATVTHQGTYVDEVPQSGIGIAVLLAETADGLRVLQILNGGAGELRDSLLNFLVAIRRREPAPTHIAFLTRSSEEGTSIQDFKQWHDRTHGELLDQTAALLKKYRPQFV